MKLIFRYIFIAGVLTLFACSSGKQLNSKSQNDLSEKAKMEYLFHFIEGNKNKTLGYFSEAVGHFNKCLELKPESAAPSYELANIYIFNNDYFNALNHAREAANKDPENSWYQLLYANLLLQNDEQDEAVKMFERIAKSDPENVEVRLQLASIYSRERKTAKEALALYEKIEEELGITEQLVFAKEKIYNALGDEEKALEEIRKLTILDPENPRYLGLYAETLINQGAFEKAEEIYKELFILDPENGLGWLSYGEFMLNQGKKEEAFTAFRKGMRDKNLDVNPKGNMIVKLQTSYKKLVDLNEIIDLVEIINKVHPNNLEGYAMMADYYVSQGMPEEARESLLKVIEGKKDNANLWGQLLQLDIELNEFSSLYDHSKQALEYFPSSNRFYLLNGYACERIKKYEEGIDILELGIDFVVDNDLLKSEFYAQMAEIYNRMDKEVKSDEAFETSIKLNPKNVSALNNYSYYLALRGEKLDTALRYIELANIIVPDNGTYLDTYAWVLYKAEKYEQALKKIEKAIQFGGDESAVIIDHYGDILYKNNKTKEAVVQWKKAMELGLKSDKLEQKIKLGKIIE